MARGRKRRRKASLLGIEDKIRRAKFHFEAFEAASGPSIEVHPDTFRGEIRDDAREHLYWWDNPPPRSPDLELILGDCIHNLRSSLDHLAYQLVLLNGEAPTNKTAFPICGCPPTKRHRILRKRIRAPLHVDGGVSPSALALIESIQPYNGGEVGTYLGILRDLDNIDKHRHLIVAIQGVHGTITGRWEDSPHAPPSPLGVQFIPGPAISGKPAFKALYTSPYHELDPYLRVHLGIQFDKRVLKRLDKRPVRAVIGPMLHIVEDKVANEMFRPLFPTA